MAEQYEDLGTAEAEDLLKRFEPVLCFYSGLDDQNKPEAERFFPMHVEDYLRECMLWKWTDRTHLLFLRRLFRGKPEDQTALWLQAAADHPDASQKGGALLETLVQPSFNTQYHFLSFGIVNEVNAISKGLSRHAKKATINVRLGSPDTGARVRQSSDQVTFEAVVDTPLSFPGIPLWLFQGFYYLLFLLYVVLFLQVSMGGGSSALIAVVTVSGLFAFALGVNQLYLEYRKPGDERNPSGCLYEFNKSFCYLAIFILYIVPIIICIGARVNLTFGVLYGIGVLIYCLVIIFSGLISLINAIASFTSPLNPAVAEVIYRKYQQINSTPAPVYYGRAVRVLNSPVVILQYFYFYAFNDFRQFGGTNFHESDWESVSIQLQDRGAGDWAITAVSASQHEGGEVKLWDELKDFNKTSNDQSRCHPVLYVGAGSHANYFNFNVQPHLEHKPRESLKHRLEAFLLNPVEKRSDQGRIVGDEKPLHKTDSPVLQPWAAPVVIHKDVNWVTFRGLWGLKTHSIVGESGVTGPLWKTYWQNPLEGFEKPTGWRSRLPRRAR